MRQALATDAKAMHRVRMSVKENRLTSIALSEHDYRVAIEKPGRGWVLEVDGNMVAFAVGNADDGNVWALFVEPAHEGKGYGRRLHDRVVSWLGDRGHGRLWLTTERDTRAERFYRTAGWKRVGALCGREIRFELQVPCNTRRTAGGAGRA